MGCGACNASASPNGDYAQITAFAKSEGCPTADIRAICGEGRVRAHTYYCLTLNSGRDATRYGQVDTCYVV